MPRAKFDCSLLPEKPDLTFELALWQQGVHFVAGIDEAGRGALVGPVCAGAVVLSDSSPDLPKNLKGVRDSKVMTPADRETWVGVIKDVAVAWGVGFASASEIDQIGIAPATRLAASRAIAELSCVVEYFLIDYITLPEISAPQTPLVKGDARSLSIAAASILAKTSRDALLVQMETRFPGYHLASNKGYGTQAHREAIAALGPCAEHRRTFAPVAAYMGDEIGK